MRIFTILVMVLSLAGGIGCVGVVQKFTVMYGETGVTLPNLTRILVNSRGWIPGGVFIALAFVLGIFFISKMWEIAARLAIATLLLLLGASAFVSFALMLPMHNAGRAVSEKDYVFDEAGIVTEAEEARLNRKISEFDKETGIYMIVVTVETLNGNRIFNESIRWWKSSGLQRPDNDKCVLIYIAPNDKQWRIGVGSELRKSLPDEVCGKIGHECIDKNFMKGLFFQGTDSCVDSLINFLGKR